MDQCGWRSGQIVGCVSIKCGEILVSWGTVSFSRRTLIYGAISVIAKQRRTEYVFHWTLIKVPSRLPNEDHAMCQRRARLSESEQRSLNVLALERNSLPSCITSSSAFSQLCCCVRTFAHFIVIAAWPGHTIWIVRTNVLHYICIGQSKELYRMFILSLLRTWQLYRTEGLHSPTYPVTAAVLRVTAKVKLCVFQFICLTIGSPTENRGGWEWLAVMQSHTCARRTKPLHWKNCHHLAVMSRREVKLKP